MGRTPIRVAVLGAGFMGSTHARAYHERNGAELVTLVAQSGKRAAALATELGCRWTDDLASVLQDETIDAVDICLPTPEHRPAVEAAIAAGKHVLVEKPLALTAADGAALVELAQTTDRTLMVAHVLRFWPEYVEIKRILDTGELGTPISGTAVRRQPFPAWSTLFNKAGITGGAILDMMIHDYDALNWMLGDPVNVTATGVENVRSSGRDQAQVLIRYAGASGIVDGGMMMPESYPFTSKLEILCERGAAEYHFQAGGRSFEVGEPTNTLTVYRNDGEPEVLTVEQGDPYVNEIAYFVECVERGVVADRATPAHAYAALQVGLAASESARTGQPVDIR